MRTELWGLGDQALVSGVNFLTIIVVARAVSPPEFGSFVLAFTVILSTLTLQAALITRAHNVLGTVRGGDAYADYSTTAAVAQLVYSAVCGCLCLLAAGIAYVADLGVTSLLLALALALVAWQLQEFGRRVLYTERRLAAATANDVLSYGSSAAALVVLWQADALTVPRALLVLAGGFAIGLVLLGRQLRVALSGNLHAPSLRESWRFGRWLGLAELGQWLSTQFFYYLAALVVSSVASGALKAGQTLLGPVAAFLAFFTSYLPIVFARELERSGTPARKVSWSLYAILPVVVLYGLAAGVFAKPLLEVVYGSEYAGYGNVVVLFAVYYVALTFSTVAVAVLSAKGATRDVFVGQAAGAAVALATGWLLLLAWGAAGGVAGMLLSWAVAMLFFVRALVPGAGTARR
jgi:O-antigen/teichoic acid export membrane protein